MKKRLISIVMIMAMLFSLCMTSFAADYSVGANSSVYTNYKTWGAPGNNYSVSLNYISRNNQSITSMNNVVKFRLYTRSGSAAGSEVSTSYAPRSFTPSVLTNYRNASGDYKLLITNTNSLPYVFGVDWNP